jgi:hypothetical protein
VVSRPVKEYPIVLEAFVAIVSVVTTGATIAAVVPPMGM